MIRTAVALALAMAVAPAAAADQAVKSAAAKKPKTCDPSKVYTGPRGGRYYYTKHCSKVYLRR